MSERVDSPSLPEAILFGIISLVIGFLFGAGVFVIGIWTPNVPAGAAFQGGAIAGATITVAAGGFLIRYGGSLE